MSFSAKLSVLKTD